MGIFKHKPKGYLGLDFGAGGIKIIQLARAPGRSALFTYGYGDRAPQEIGVDYLENPAVSGELLKRVCTAARVTSAVAVAALPIPAVFSAVLSLAAVPKKEMAQAVQWEAKKLIPLPLEEVTVDFKELKRADSAASEVIKKTDAARDEAHGKSVEILLTAAPRSIIEKYVAIAKLAGLTLASLETEAFALIRAILGADPTPTIIVDMGAVRSNILFVDRSIPMLTRSVEIGGRKCTEAIAGALGIDLTRAEAMKRDLGVSPLPAESPSGGLHSVIIEVLQPLLNEMKYSFTVYRTRNIF